MKITFECNKEILLYLVEHQLLNKKYDKLMQNCKSYNLETELKRRLYEKVMTNNDVVEIDNEIEEIREYLWGRKRQEEKAKKLVSKNKLKRFEEYRYEIPHNILTQYATNLIISSIAEELKEK